MLLNRNKIKFLQPGLFQNLSKLKRLELEQNPLSELKNEDTFCGLENLLMLRVHDSRLAEVTSLSELPIITKHMKNVRVDPELIELIDSD